MTFFENLNRICRKQGLTPTALLKEMGVSTSKVTRWSNGSLPKQEMLLRLAEELHCSVMDFFQDEEGLKKSTYFILSEDEREVVRMFRSLTTREKHLFMASAYNHEKETMRRDA